ncbi:TPA: hypothetical protein HIE86_003339 [Escherichia coli]|nr:hypothetical protein [Escherichia coli]
MSWPVFLVCPVLLATEVHKLREYAGMTRKAALKHIVDGVRMGALPDRIIEAANTANARQGNRPELRVS